MEVFDERDELQEPETVISEKTEIQNFYTDKTILITGGSGFLGILLIEKLLRACTDLKKIILLLREKKGKSTRTRIKEIFQDEIFDKMRLQNPNFWKQVEILPGCCEDEMLGIDNARIQKLQSEVNIIFHSAATVRFNEHIRKAYAVNVNGTKSLLEIAKGMENLIAFVYVSTLYCQSHLSHIEEKFYPGALTDEEMLTLLERLGDRDLGILTPKLLDGRYNTYTMTKAMAEEIIGKYRSKIPVAIFRPSIVTATIAEPLICWTNNINGATGVFIGSAVGFLRTLLCDADGKAEIIPADRVINGLIAVPLHIQKYWYSLSAKNRGAREPVFNYVTNQNNVKTWGSMMEILLRFMFHRKLITDTMIWAFHLSLTRNRLVWLIQYYFIHLLPAPAFMLMEKLTKQKPRIWKGYIQLYRHTYQLSYFMLQSWKISTSNTNKLFSGLSAEDKILFNCDSNVDWNHYLFFMSKGLGKYILKFDWNCGGRAIILRRYILASLDFIVVWTFRCLMILFIWRMCCSFLNNFI